MRTDGKTGNIARLQRYLADLGRGWAVQELRDAERADVEAGEGEAEVDDGAHY